MKGLPASFFASAVVYAILGLILGNVMAASGDHSQMVTHAHMMLIGWVSFAIFGLFYHLFAERCAALLARAHFWLAQVSFIALVVGLFAIYSGQESAGSPIAAVASIAYLASMVVFAVVALPVLRVRRG